MKISKVGYLALSFSLTLMTLSLAGCGGSSDASTQHGAGQGPGGGRGWGQAHLTGLSGGCQGCPAQGSCAQKNSGCGESGDSCSKNQCPGQAKSCGSEVGQCSDCDKTPTGCGLAHGGCGSQKSCGFVDGQCGDSEKGGCGSEKECCGCSGASDVCDSQKCLECPQAGSCDKIDLTGLGATDTMAPPLPRSGQ